MLKRIVNYEVSDEVFRQAVVVVCVALLAVSLVGQVAC